VIKYRGLAKEQNFAKLTKLPQLRSSVTGRKDQDITITISAFLRERMFSGKLKRYWIIFTVNTVILASPHTLQWPMWPSLMVHCW